MYTAPLAPQTTTPMALVTILSQLLSDAVSTLDHDRDCTRNTLSRAVALLDAEHATMTNSDGPGGLAPWQAKAVAREINANLERNISVEELAKMVRLSRSRFSKAFKSTFQTGPQKFIVERRVDRAQQMMMTSDDSLGQIAISCGFCDQAHFSRVFRQVTGYTPHAWRRARLGMQKNADLELAAAAA